MNMRVRGAALAALWMLCAGAFAQDPDPAAQLGMAEPALRAGPQLLERVPHPERLASGARGLWRVARTHWGGMPFQQTFYLAQGTVQRIEWLLLPEALTAADGSGLGAFGRVVTLLQTSLGPALVAGDVASWVAGDVDVAAYRTPSAGGARVRIVYKTRVLRDASAL